MNCMISGLVMDLQLYDHQAIIRMEISHKDFASLIILQLAQNLPLKSVTSIK